MTETNAMSMRCCIDFVVCCPLRSFTGPVVVFVIVVVNFQKPIQAMVAIGEAGALLNRNLQKDFGKIIASIFHLPSFFSATYSKK
jgi:hypothetical protein